MDPGQLVEEAMKVKADAFTELVNEVKSLLAGEEGRVGELEVIGRLVKLPDEGEAVIVGDIHGDLKSLYHVLRDTDFMRRAQEGEPIYAVFLGDYADRGIRGPEVYYVVLKLKEMYPDRVVLLRGNHEGPSDILAMPHDLPFHIISKFGREEGVRAYKALRELWSFFFTAALVKDKVIMLHGGAPTTVRRLEDLAFAHEKHPREPILEEVLWSDPEEGITGAYPSWRGAGKLFGPDVTKRFLSVVGARALVRGHEPCPAGYKLNHEDLIMTVFSRKGPPYFNEQAAYLWVPLSAQVLSARDLEKWVRTF